MQEIGPVAMNLLCKTNEVPVIKELLTNKDKQVHNISRTYLLCKSIVGTIWHLTRPDQVR